MNDGLFDPERENNDLFGYGQEDMDDYGEGVNNYYDEDIEEGEDDAGDEYYSEELEAAEARHSRARAARTRAARRRAARARAARMRAARRRAPRARAVRARYGYAGRRYSRVPRDQQRYPSGFPPPSMEPGNFPQTPVEPGDFPQMSMEPGDFPQMPMEPGDFPPMSMEPGNTDMPPDEMVTFEMAEQANYIPEAEDDMADDDMSEFSVEYEPDMFDDSAELAESLREVMHAKYEGATSEEMQEALFNILETMTPAEGFSFGNVLGQIASAGQKVLKNPVVGQIASTALPVAGGTLGTVVGGPIGTAIGAKLGQAAGQAFSGGRKPSPASSAPVKVAGTTTGSVAPTTEAPPAGTATGSAAPAAKTSPNDGSTAAAQLLQLTQNPDLLKSLLALALGSNGRESIEVGTSGQSVPVGGYMNLLNKLATEAAADADELLRETDNASDYLRNSEGEFLGDPAVPEDRAQVLYESLIGAENQRLAAEQAAPQTWWDFFPFGRGATLLVEYETPIRNFNVGIMNVLERLSNQLKVKLHIDKWERFNVPETDAMIAIEHRNEGAGNRADVVVNGSTFTDNNVTIRTKGNTREIFMAISILGQQVDRIALTRKNLDKATLEFKAGGAEHVLILTRK